MARPPVTLRQLEYLSELAATGHFRRAAERLGITQPSLSAQIAALEKILGARLVERGSTTAVLTPLGREVLARSQRILADVQELVDVAQADALSGVLRVGVSPTLGPYLMPKLVARLHREHPSLKLHIREGLPNDIVRDLGSGVHDVVLVQLPIASEEYVVHRLFREPLLVAMATDDVLAQEPAVRPEALAGRAFLTLSAGYKLTEQTVAFAGAVGAQVLRDYEGTSLDTIRQMAGMGMGLALLPALYVLSEIREGRDVAVKPVVGRRLHRDIGIAWRRSAGRVAAYELLAHTMAEVGQKITA